MLTAATETLYFMKLRDEGDIRGAKLTINKQLLLKVPELDISSTADNSSTLSGTNNVM